MKLAFCTPFKPLTHPRISGDVTIADDLATFFRTRGHDVWLVPHVTTRYIWKRPQDWAQTFATMQLVRETLHSHEKPDIWFTYHSYYKAPDILGSLAVRAEIPYTIFAPSHAFKRKRVWKTKPGYYLNKRALQHADHLFTNKQRDLEGLEQLVPSSHISFVPPGIKTDDFLCDEQARHKKRIAWNASDKTIVLTVAMLREGTKSEGVEYVIKACEKLAVLDDSIFLVIAGDGTMRSSLEEKAQQALPDKHLFLGTVPSTELPEVYSASDIFAFPGINEGLGMVYLEAQSCGLPVVAWDHDGAPQVVADGTTGFITPSFDIEAFIAGIQKLAASPELRATMGNAARAYVTQEHDIYKNYKLLEEKLHSLIY